MPAFVYTSVAAGPHQPYLAYLRKWLPRAAALVPHAPAEVAISLVGDAKMAALHRQFLNVPGSTDVLSFELDHTPRGRCTAGEVVVCVPYAAREAKRRGHDTRTELLLYALHGLLHLSGYDDRTPTDHRRMHRTEDRILTAIGIGTVYARPAPSPGMAGRGLG